MECVWQLVKKCRQTLSCKDGISLFDVCSHTNKRGRGKCDRGRNEEKNRKRQQTIRTPSGDKDGLFCLSIFKCLGSVKYRTTVTQLRSPPFAQMAKECSA